MRRVALLLGVLLIAGGLAPALARSSSAAGQVVLVPLPGGFQFPVTMAQHPDSDDLFIVEKVGTIRALRAGLVFDPVPVLDISSEVSGGLEQGLLGLAFSPDGRFMYIYFTARDGDARLVEFRYSDGAVDLGSRREVLVIEQPQANHNGGSINFGPDGLLYLGLGDGGGAGDPGGNGQDRSTLLGSMLRIDPRPHKKAPYRVPAGNPFARAGAKARPEIWAYGLRNPWKHSFDRTTGDLWIADVGQSAWEEVNLQPARSKGGQNYGWNHMEGLEPYAGRTGSTRAPRGHVPPVHVYPNANGSCSVTGGYVYRGEAIPSLAGAYVYSDWCDGRLRYIRVEKGEVVEDEELGVTVPSITSFGEDHDGELYAISFGGTIFKLLPGLP